MLNIATLPVEPRAPRVNHLGTCMFLLVCTAGPFLPPACSFACRGGLGVPASPAVEQMIVSRFGGIGKAGESPSPNLESFTGALCRGFLFFFAPTVAMKVEPIEKIGYWAKLVRIGPYIESPTRANLPTASRLSCL